MKQELQEFRSYRMKNTIFDFNGCQLPAWLIL
jgi:hypothetical protein